MRPKDEFWYMRKDIEVMKLITAFQNFCAKAPNEQLIFSSTTRNGHEL